MKTLLRVSAWLLLLTIGMIAGNSAAQDSRFALGVRGGAGRIEGDVKESVIKPFASGTFQYMPAPHIAIGIEAGVAEFSIDDDTQQDSVARVLPVELDITLRYSPYHRVTPFVTIGGGGIIYQTRLKESGVIIGSNPDKVQNTYAVKTAGGLDISLSHLVTLTFGASYRYSFTDNLDLGAIGDEDDQIINAFAGLTFNLGNKRLDGDHDGVLDRYDVDSYVKEDRDGYMDHDGIPDVQISTDVTAFASTPVNEATDQIPPIVIHSPKLRTTAGRELELHAEIFENHGLRKAAILYRPYGVGNWSVEPMLSTNNFNYRGIIPGLKVQKVGLEYCVVAVDEAISGVGYSGLPKRPNFVMVHGSETGWRVATVLTAVGAWGGAAYLVSREQQH